MKLNTNFTSIKITNHAMVSGCMKQQQAVSQNKAAVNITRNF